MLNQNVYLGDKLEDAIQMVHQNLGLICRVTKLSQMEHLVIVNVKEEKGK